ncbi:MAG: hypothetical protein LBQ01_04585 [Prevotellaceae bacterium]|jgi:hypothetical protein|nr:hypothetical protein [Prevotellaceae bacterium]
MKKIIMLTVLVLSSAILHAESAELNELLYSAKSKNKLILLKIYHSETSGLSFDSIPVSDRFIEASLYASNPSDREIINEYRVESYPSIILLNSNGHLILPVKKVDHLSEIEAYTDKALKTKYDSKPLAQFDLEYRNNKMNKTSLYEYIVTRTSLGLDNSNIIDRYTQSVTPGDLLNRKTLMLFIDENNFNIPGAFYSFIEQNQEEIKQVLKLGDERFYRLAEKSIEYNFRKICADKDESSLRHIIDVKVNTFNAGDRDILYSEYMTRYFHATYQPLKLIDHAREYVSAVLKYKDLQEKEISGKNKLLFSSPLKNSIVRTQCAARLRDAAQYIVEIMSAKSVLNNALSWTVEAEQLADDDKCDIYETRAYILYKLGKRDEAITNMEKSYNSISQNNIEQKKNVGFNLIKMKRGEKIY